MIEKNSKEHMLLQCIKMYPRHNIIRYKKETGLSGLEHAFQKLLNEGLIKKHKTPDRRVFYTASMRGKLLLDIWLTEEEIDDCFANISSVDYAIFLESMEKLKEYREHLQNFLSSRERLLSMLQKKFAEMK